MRLGGLFVSVSSQSIEKPAWLHRPKWALPYLLRPTGVGGQRTGAWGTGACNLACIWGSVCYWGTATSKGMGIGRSNELSEAQDGEVLVFFLSSGDSHNLQGFALQKQSWKTIMLVVSCTYFLALKGVRYGPQLAEHKAELGLQCRDGERVVLEDHFTIPKSTQEANSQHRTHSATKCEHTETPRM